MKARLTYPVILALILGIALVAILAVLFFNFSTRPNGDGTAVEHRYISLIGDLEDDVIKLDPSESRTFTYTLEQSRGDTGLMTGFIQLARANNTGISSVRFEISSSSDPTYFHELLLSDGQLKQVEFIIPKSGSVTFENEGDRMEEIMLNLQLTYFALK